jgi:hypothetical protein
MARLNTSHVSHKTLRDPKIRDNLSPRPTILAPAESERDKGVDYLDMVNYEMAMQQRLTDSSQKNSTSTSKRNSYDATSRKSYN